jgi:hypothetical protein
VGNIKGRSGVRGFGIGTSAPASICSRLPQLCTVKLEDSNVMTKQILLGSGQQKRERSERLAKQLNDFLAEQTAKEQAGKPHQD